jgi:NitT/TauT family transport system ATP-binding protein
VTGPLLEVRNLSKGFESAAGSGYLPVLKDLSFQVAAGEFVAVVGPSGCGKTTLLRVLAGLLPPSAGRVTIAGREPELARRQKEVGFVFQTPALLPWRTVVGNIRLALEVNRIPRPALDPEELLRLTGLAEFAHYYPHQLSGGMAQRVALARALVFDPRLLLMDEPFSALDELTRSALRYELLRVWEQTRKTVVFVTHSIPEAVILADRVLVLSHRPARLAGEFEVDLPRPRHEDMEDSAPFREAVRWLKSRLRAA